MLPRTKAILDELKPLLIERYGERLVKLVLFGSQARGDAEPDSDIDVLVVLKGEVDAGVEIEHCGDIAAALSMKHETLISLAYISEVRFRTRNSPLILNVRREGVAL